MSCQLTFATLIVRVTLISLFFLQREIREIVVSRKFHVIRQQIVDRASMQVALRICNSGGQFQWVRPYLIGYRTTLFFFKYFLMYACYQNIKSCQILFADLTLPINGNLLSCLVRHHCGTELSAQIKLKVSSLRFLRQLW